MVRKLILHSISDMLWFGITLIKIETFYQLKKLSDVYKKMSMVKIWTRLAALRVVVAIICKFVSFHTSTYWIVSICHSVMKM